MPERGRTWKVGELARLTGLTVRTLHHYEHVGLVAASRRTAAGHRIYGEADLRRLYRVLALRDLGLPLEAIGELLDGGPDLEGLLGGQLAQVERRIEALTALRGRLAAVLAAARAGGLSSDHLLAIIEGMSDVQGSMDDYFTREQLAELDRRREDGGGKAAEAAAAWPGLIAEVGAAMADGTDPASPRARELARRWTALLEEFHRGDGAMKDSLFRMYEENSEEVRAEYGGPSPEMIDFITRASAAGG
ncbi:MerR family transcriptional regulator [Nocardiopsis sp. CNT-189]|uniref:MerR family transcriptional regulator n=1 Tax=Nocardiopsis oceanisediminis TaxID=2816862 RepID=UPI003B3265AF